MNSLEQIEKAWAPVQESFQQSTRDEASLEATALKLTEFAHVAESNSGEELSRGASQLAKLVNVSATWLNSYPDDTDIVDEIMEFVERQQCELQACIGSDESNPKIDEMIELSNEAWSDYFVVAEEVCWESASFDDGFDSSVDFESESNDEMPSGSEIEMLLGAVTALTETTAALESTAAIESTEGETEALTETEVEAETETVEADEQVEPESMDDAPVAEPAEAEPADEGDDPDKSAREELRSDPEMLEAYLDDSLRCVAAMESAALSLDEKPDDKDSIRAFCRELHTLKGASATVGLSGLAKQMHDLETSLEEVFAADGDSSPERLFEAIDFVRKEMDSLKPQAKAQPQPNNATGPQPAKISMAPNARIVSPVAASISKSPTRASFAPSDNSSIRIRASQLDRLMDMLAELVVLRNRRESNASEFDLLYGELSRCSTRLSIVEEQSGKASNNSVVGEVSKDIEAVARGFRALQKPVANDNTAITRFIRDFRHELMHLRRVPVSGLFGRLQRAARDAAKKESKQVRLVGSGRKHRSRAGNSGTAL